MKINALLIGTLCLTTLSFGADRSPHFTCSFENYVTTQTSKNGKFVEVVRSEDNQVSEWKERVADVSISRSSQGLDGKGQTAYRIETHNHIIRTTAKVIDGYPQTVGKTLRSEVEIKETGEEIPGNCIKNF